MLLRVHGRHNPSKTVAYLQQMLRGHIICTWRANRIEHGPGRDAVTGNVPNFVSYIGLRVLLRSTVSTLPFPGPTGPAPCPRALSLREGPSEVPGRLPVQTHGESSDTVGSSRPGGIIMKQIIRPKAFLAVPVLGAALLFPAFSPSFGNESGPTEGGTTSASKSRVPTSGEPVVFENLDANATRMCAEVGGFEYACKIDGWEGNDMTGRYICPLGPWEGDSGYNDVTIANTDGTSFDWSAIHAVGAVVVHGGGAAHVFYNEPGAPSHTRSFAPRSADGEPTPISHVTFCWGPDNR